jgi:hypothetical protein
VPHCQKDRLGSVSQCALARVCQKRTMSRCWAVTKRCETAPLEVKSQLNHGVEVQATSLSNDADPKELAKNLGVAFVRDSSRACSGGLAEFPGSPSSRFSVCGLSVLVLPVWRRNWAHHQIFQYPPEIGMPSAEIHLVPANFSRHSKQFLLYSQRDLHVRGPRRHKA